jgi:hypothetical protein
MANIKPVINKPEEKPRTSFTGNDFESPAKEAEKEVIVDALEATLTPAIPPDDCTLRGLIPRNDAGSDFFQASAELHQRHSRAFTCLDVIIMEQVNGRHALGCAHVGYWTSKACKCVPEVEG